MRRWVSLIPIGILLAIALASSAAPQITSLVVSITNYEADKVTPGSTFQINVTVSKPAGITISTGQSLIYCSMFYFVNDAPVFPAKGHWEVQGGGGSTYYVEGTTNYTLKVQMKSDAPVGQTGVFLGVYLTIPITGSDHVANPPAQGDNTTFSIGENSYTVTIVNVKAIPGSYTTYYIVDESGWDVYLRSDKDQLYVRALASNVEIKGSTGGGFSIPVIPVVGVIIILVVIAAVVVVVKKRGAAEVPLPPPPAPPTI